MYTFSLLGKRTKVVNYTILFAGVYTDSCPIKGSRMKMPHPLKSKYILPQTRNRKGL